MASSKNSIKLIIGRQTDQILTC